jgi:hypothetical protein
MRDAAWIFVVMSTAAFAQSAPDNLAGDAFKKRVQDIKLLDLPNLYSGKRILMAGIVKPQVCAIPLLRATPSAKSEPMRIAKPTVSPEATSCDEMLQVPAPACKK